MWLSPLENMRLNTVSSWPKQECPAGPILPSLKSMGTLSDFAGCCELLSKLLHHSGIEFTMSIKSLLPCAGMAAIIFSILFIIALVGFSNYNLTSLAYRDFLPFVTIKSGFQA